MTVCLQRHQLLFRGAAEDNPDGSDGQDGPDGPDGSEGINGPDQMKICL